MSNRVSLRVKLACIFPDRERSDIRQWLLSSYWSLQESRSPCSQEISTCGKLQNSTSVCPQTMHEAAASESCVKNLAPCEPKGQPTPNRQASYSPIICYFIFAEQREGRESNCESKPSFKKKKITFLCDGFFFFSFLLQNSKPQEYLHLASLQLDRKNSTAATSI